MGVLGAAGLPLRSNAQTTSPTVPPADDRAYWVSVLEKISRPVLMNLSRRELRKNMPVEAKPGATPDRSTCTHL